MRHVIFINGPVGVGKTTLGRAAAAAIGAGFIDSDDLRDPAKRWFEQVLTVSRALVGAALAALREHHTVIIARPLRARDWAFFRARLGEHGVAVHCITLTADAAAILDPGRGRVFDDGERARIAVMIGQGYGARPFRDLTVGTDRAPFADTVAALAAACRELVAAQRY